MTPSDSEQLHWRSTIPQKLLNLGALAIFVRKLDKHIELAANELEALHEAIGPICTYGRYEDLFAQGDPIDAIVLLCSGITLRHKMMPNGRRQIMGYSLPGDFCGGCSFLRRDMDQTVTTLATSNIVTLSRDRVIALSKTFPRIAMAFWLNSLVDESIAREWLINVGQRTALERIAHLLCELVTRFGATGLVDSDSFELPFTQAEIADTVALSVVHVNRTLTALRRRKLISINGKELTIHDVQALRILAMFDPAYLHFDQISAGQNSQFSFQDDAHFKPRTPQASNDPMLPHHRPDESDIDR